MPASIPLVSELGNKADLFQSLLNTSTIPRDVLAKVQPMHPSHEIFTNADSRVLVRCRPIIPRDECPMTDTMCVQRAPGSRDAIFLSPKISVAGKCTVEPTRIPLDGCFCGTEDTTEHVYRSCCAPLVELSMNGASCCVLCYGQTGSGKTFTTSGLLSLVASDLKPYFETHSLAVTVIEIQSLGATDLLTGASVQVVEDASNEIQLLGSKDTEVVAVAQLLSLLQRASSARSTKATGRNETSSRSHMVVRITARSKVTTWAKPGIIYVADLAGSENTADSATHDKGRQLETKFINTSLMTLKDCIRSRALAATSTQHLHIPYRQSPLTLMLRDCFELAVKRPTKTVVIACVSPLLCDVRHTSNTLRYASLLAVSPPPTVVATDPDDPNGWDRPTALAFLAKVGKGRVKHPDLVLPEGDGRALVHIPEAEFIARITSSHPEVTAKSAKMVYDQVWKAVIDARTKHRKLSTKGVQSARNFPASKPPMQFDVPHQEKENATPQRKLN